MTPRTPLVLLALLPLAVAQVACGLASGTATPTPAAPPPVATATPTAETPPTQTAEPPVTPTIATPTNTPEPTATAAPVGPSCAVAYTRAGQLYCRADDGNEILLTAVDGGSLQGAALSSDGTWVAYIIGVPDGPADLFSVSVANALAGDLTPEALANDTNLTGMNPDDMVSARVIAFVPGTQTLLFDTRYVPAGGIIGPGEYQNNDLWRVNVDGSELAQIAPAGTAGRFAISPTGGHVALSSANSISVLDLAANSITPALEFDPIMTYSEYAFKPEANWAPDGSVFTVAVPSVDPMAADANVTLHRITTAGVEEPLGLVPGNFVFGGVLSLSPLGDRVAYGVRDASGRLDSVTVRRLPDDPGPGGANLPEIQWLDWSADGTRLAIGHRNVVNNAQILEPDGSLRSLDLSVVEIVWRDADAYYLVANGDGSFDIDVLRPSGVQVLATALPNSLWAVR